jgi:hypothetical protein
MEIPPEILNDNDTNSGTRMRGIFYPPVAGTYTFAVAGDSDAALFIGGDAK